MWLQYPTSPESASESLDTSDTSIYSTLSIRDTEYSFSCKSPTEAFCTTQSLAAIKALPKDPNEDKLELGDSVNIWALDYKNEYPLNDFRLGFPYRNIFGGYSTDLGPKHRHGSFSSLGQISAAGFSPIMFQKSAHQVAPENTCNVREEPMQKSPKISAINPKYVPVQYQQQQQKKWTPLPFKNYVGTQFNVSPTSKFFVIKSYTLLDVNASFINNIWASTELGNKRLSSAFKKAADDQGEVYLFFSVNGSGKFCGVAKMTSDLDMEKSSNIWFETSKWKGVFDVDWLMVKDIPNKYFHFLKVAANENKPVSNSRDTQEIPLNIALEMLKIFSTFKTSTSFLMC